VWDHSGQCPVQYVQNSEPAIEHFDWLILVTDFVLFLAKLTIAVGLGEFCVRCCDYSVRNDFGKASEESYIEQ